MDKIVRCCKCYYYNKRSLERSTKSEFIDGENHDSGGIKLPSLIIEMDFGCLTICSHPNCFSYEKSVDPTYGKQYSRKRIKGQGQLNSTNSCSYFKKAWWRFWIRDNNPKEEDLFLDKI